LRQVHLAGVTQSVPRRVASLGQVVVAGWAQLVSRVARPSAQWALAGSEQSGGASPVPAGQRSAGAAVHRPVASSRVVPAGHRAAAASARLVGRA
jgi:hypothetical protein